MSWSHRTIRAIGVTVLACWLAACGGDQGDSPASSAGTTTTAEMSVTGQGAPPECTAGTAADRRYLLCVPQDVERPRLVLALHGRNGSGAELRTMTDLDGEGARRGLAVVYVDAADGGWGDDSLRTAKRPRGDEDVTTLAAVVDDLREDGGFAAGPVGVVGFSNGASMAMRLGAERPDLFGPVAAVAGQLPVDQRIRPTSRVRLLMMNGTADPIRDYERGFPAPAERSVSARTPTLSVMGSVEAWLGIANGAVTEAPPVTPGTDDVTSVVRRTWNDADGVLLVLDTVVGGGHTWPSSRLRAPTTFGATSTALDATAEVIGFLAE